MASDPIRVLAVTNIWPVGDSFRGIFVQEQVEALQKLGHDVDVEVVAQGRGRSDYLLAAARIRRRVRTGGYDLIHIHYGLNSVAARFAGPIPSVISIYGSDVNIPWQRIISRIGIGHAKARIYVSENLRRAAHDPAGHIIPHGIDFDLFRPGDRARARQVVGLTPDEPVILFGARPSNPVKGYDVFTAVLEELRRRGRPIRELLLPQPGQPRSAVPQKFTAADVLLFTSLQGSEGSPGVVKEAVAMGLPVVSVDVGDVRQTLAGVTPSVVVEFGDRLVDRLADRVEETLSSGTRSDGRERIAGLDLMIEAERIADVYRTVLRR